MPILGPLFMLIAGTLAQPSPRRPCLESHPIAPPMRTDAAAPGVDWEGLVRLRPTYVGSSVPTSFSDLIGQPLAAALERLRATADTAARPPTMPGGRQSPIRLGSRDPQPADAEQACRILYESRITSDLREALDCCPASLVISGVACRLTVRLGNAALCLAFVESAPAVDDRSRCLVGLALRAADAFPFCVREPGRGGAASPPTQEP